MWVFELGSRPTEYWPQPPTQHVLELKERQVAALVCDRGGDDHVYVGPRASASARGVVHQRVTLGVAEVLTPQQATNAVGQLIQLVDVAR